MRSQSANGLSFTITEVPEPVSLTIMLAGLGAIGLVWRRA